MFAAFAAIADNNGQEAVVTGPIKAPRPDLDARSDFRVADIVSHEYLVLTVKITADDVAAESAALARGPEKASGLIDDLRVTAYSGADVEAVYAMADPRIVRWHAGDHLTLGHQETARESALTKIYLPLSATIDRVTIRPSPLPDRRPGVSQGGEIDRAEIYNLGRRACGQKDRAQYAGCAGFDPLPAELILP